MWSHQLRTPWDVLCMYSLPSGAGAAARLSEVGCGKTEVISDAPIPPLGVGAYLYLGTARNWMLTSYIPSFEGW